MTSIHTLSRARRSPAPGAAPLPRNAASRRHFFLGVGLAVALAGCGGRGALSQATMFRECPAGDDTCHRATPAAPVAVGARLRPDVSVDVAGTVMPTVALATSRPDILAIDDGILVGVEPGMSAVLIATTDGTVIDFQHVWVAAPTAIVVERPAPTGLTIEEVTGSMQLVTGEQLVLSSALVGGAQRLAGDGDMRWEVESAGGSEVVSLLRDGTSGRRRIVARGPGTARVTVATLGLTTTVDVEVVP